MEALAGSGGGRGKVRQSSVCGVHLNAPCKPGPAGGTGTDRAHPFLEMNWHIHGPEKGITLGWRLREEKSS